MNYTKNFEKVLKLNTFIGSGNPNSKILIVGKEVATDVEAGTDIELEKNNLEAYNRNCDDWKVNVINNTSQDSVTNWNGTSDNNPLYAFKGITIKVQGHTWNKYQKLNNFVFDKENNKSLNFQEDFFITEMSVLHSKTTGKEQKKEEFIKKFPVVVLACSNYICGEEICDIFNVQFIEEKGEGNQRFWIHLNSNKSKLVIHTRQLSMAVTDQLLKDIAFEIKTFLNR